jgi:hypothetical protein
MADFTLSTRTEAECIRCQTEYRLAEPTDALAERPVRVNVFCSNCGKAASIILAERGARRGSVRPSAPPEFLPRHTTSVTISANADIGGGKIARGRREVG